MLGNKVIGMGWGGEVAKALGLDGKSVLAIDLRIRPRELVTATVEMVVCSEQADALLNVLSAYHLEKDSDHTSREVEPGEDITALADTVQRIAAPEKERMMEFFKRDANA